MFTNSTFYYAKYNFNLSFESPETLSVWLLELKLAHMCKIEQYKCHFAKKLWRFSLKWNAQFFLNYWNLRHQF